MIKLGLMTNNCTANIQIGMVLENNAEQIQFDISDWVEAFGTGVPQLRVQRAGDTVPYPVVLDFADGIATWTVSNADTSVYGYGEIQLLYTVDDVLKKSAILRFLCNRSLVGDGPAPDPYDDWLEQLEQIAAETTEQADRAENEADRSGQEADRAGQEADRAEAAVQDAETYANAASDSATAAAGSSSDAYGSAQAADGYAQAAEDARDAAQASQAAIEGMDADATTLAPGSDATATFDGQTLHFGIPRGDTGATGPVGPTGPQGPTGPTGATGNGISSVTKTGTSGLVDTYTITFTDGSTTTFEVTNGEDGTVTPEQMAAAIAAALVDYAKTDGYYIDMSVGNAEQLISDIYETDSVPYTFRTSGGSMDIGDREVDEIVGGTVAWNQLCNSASVTVQSGHKYYLLNGGTSSVGASTGVAITGLTSGTDMVVDLTLALGSAIADYVYTLETGTAGAGVAWLKAHFPKMFGQYNAYEPGALESVTGVSAHEMRGFNQWDEEWELGGINSNTGEPTTNTDRIRSKNFCRCLPSTAYYAVNKVSASGTNLYIWYYDADKNFISGAGKNNVAFSTPENAYYFKISTYGGNYTNYNNDICINLHCDGSRDGEYEPYVKHIYALDPDVTLYGVPYLDENNKLKYNGDIYHSDGTIDRRYGVVDLGTLNWETNTSGIFYADGTSLGYSRNNSQAAKCSKYLYNGSANSSSSVESKPDKTMYFNLYSGRDWVFVKDTTYTDAATFKTAMSGVYLVYELATPTTESATPYTNPQVVDDFGTEEYVTDSIVPVGHVTQYQPDLKAKLEMAPDSPDTDGDYIVRHSGGQNAYVSLSSNATIQSMLDRITALENA